ncbi:hypothetical protein F7661_14445 [Pseudomonas sp. CFA]|nr:hypothetical protein F7661_14445 [Pseudomonas sp. CFA]
MGRACGPISTRRSPLPPPPYSRVNPLLHRLVVDTHRGWTQAAVGAGLPANTGEAGAISALEQVQFFAHKDKTPTCMRR